MSEVVKLEDAVLNEAQSEVRSVEDNANLPINDPNYDPMAGPAALFGLFGPQLFSLTKKLSNRQLRRMLNFLVTYPLEDIKLNKKDPLEMETFKIADRLITSKYLMILTTAFEEQERRRLAADQAKAADEAKPVSETQSAETPVVEAIQTEVK